MFNLLKGSYKDVKFTFYGSIVIFLLIVLFGVRCSNPNDSAQVNTNPADYGYVPNEPQNTISAAPPGRKNDPNGPDLIWFENYSGKKGDRISADLMISNDKTPVDAFTIKIGYDKKKFKYIDWEDGSLDPGWMMLNANEAKTGEVTIGGFMLEGNLPAGSKGSLVKLVFEVTCESCTASDKADFTVNSMFDDIEYFNKRSGTFSFQ